mmetsp:Transcript_17128/g.20749  ORF Transcript_17128/g.20749 Transcript_17128/m.20749 type:complete len:205 (-) Transcript_17128:2229-2843(-)
MSLVTFSVEVEISSLLLATTTYSPCLPRFNVSGSSRKAKTNPIVPKAEVIKLGNRYGFFSRNVSLEKTASWPVVTFNVSFMLSIGRLSDGIEDVQPLIAGPSISPNDHMAVTADMPIALCSPVVSSWTMALETAMIPLKSPARKRTSRAISNVGDAPNATPPIAIDNRAINRTGLRPYLSAIYPQKIEETIRPTKNALVTYPAT